MPDSELADKIRYLLSPESGFTERKMFGGLCFMVGGHMTCGITGEGDLMLRIGPAAYESALLEAGVRPMDFTGRPMKELHDEVVEVALLPNGVHRHDVGVIQGRHGPRLLLEARDHLVIGVELLAHCNNNTNLNSGVLSFQEKARVKAKEKARA